MEFSFSTLGCPRWTLSEIITAAKDLGYGGIELRGLGDDIFLPDAAVFQNGGKGAGDIFASRGLKIPCISTECELHRNSPDLESKISAYISLAAALACPYIRVMGDSGPDGEGNVDVALVRSNLKAFAAMAEKQGVCLLLETNGIFSQSALLAETVRYAGSEGAAALWDINHPVRYANEAPEVTAENLKGLVRHMHVKDTAVEDGQIVYKMFGKGTLPIVPIFRLMKDQGYQGFVSLEWTKRWHPELAEPGVVFSHFIFNAKRMWERA